MSQKSSEAVLMVPRNPYQPMRNGDYLYRWAEDNAFWEKQPYGNRFYFGDGVLDYVPRDLLRHFVESFPELRLRAVEPIIPEPPRNEGRWDGDHPAFRGPDALENGRGFTSGRLTEAALELSTDSEQVRGKRFCVKASHVVQLPNELEPELIFLVFEPSGEFRGHYFAKALTDLAR